MTVSIMKSGSANFIKVITALHALSDYMAMRDQYFAASIKAKTFWRKSRFQSLANKRMCKAIVVHDRILTGKRPL